MSIEKIKQGVAQGSALFEGLPTAKISEGWDGLDLETVKGRIYDAMLAVRGLHENLAGMMPAIGAVSQGAEHGNLQLQAAGEGSDNFDMLDVLSSAGLLVEANYKLGAGIAAMETFSADVINTLVSTTMLLGNLAALHDQIAEERLVETVTATPAQVVQHARDYIRDH